MGRQEVIDCKKFAGEEKLSDEIFTKEKWPKRRKTLKESELELKRAFGQKSTNFDSSDN